MIRRILLYYTVTSLLISSCNVSTIEVDGSGVFEATEVIISSEANGQLLDLNIEEGTTLKAQERVGQIDCRDITLQKAQVMATMGALKLKRSNATPEIAVIKKQLETQNAHIETQRVQLKVLLKERDRMKVLVNQEAAPGKQLDDIQGQVDILRKQIDAAELQIVVLEQQMISQQEIVTIKNRGVMSEQAPLLSNIDRIENQLKHCEIWNPLEGTVIEKYVEKYEYVNVGKPLYKIADLKQVVLRAYLSGDQLASLVLGQEVVVLVDKNIDEYHQYQGAVIWIAEEAEFTPKTIQTKNERANLVYAVKIAVQNDGFIRIGMYGDIQI